MSDEKKPEVLEEKEEKVEEQEVEAPEEAPVEEETAEEPEEEVHYENAVNKGDFIKLEMTGTAEETGEVFETTSEELARESGIHSEERVYGPRLVIVGDGFVLRGLDSRLPGTPFDEEKEIQVPAEEAFGERNPANVQMIAYRVLRSKGVTPALGAELEIDGRPAIIRSVGAGRVQVDYNHPLAGRNIIYKVKVAEHITHEKNKMEALIGRRFLGIEPSEFEVKKTKKKLRIGVPDKIFFGENIQIAKRGVALDILKYFPDLEEVEYYETIKRS
ncbi:MAG: FKBP-type peptidyl-prolyl cis-trans isomerase [Candidatus Bathyarchaeota archaeon]